MSSEEIVLTELDVVRLERLLDSESNRPAERSDGAKRLDERLEVARVVAGRQVSPDVVTMNSVVRLRDEAGGEVSEVRLVYPSDLAGGGQRISVLSPLGLVLLGARAGERLAASLPGGGYRNYVVEALVFQPEAAGIYDL